jgi:DNA-binding NtrC family response regulator
MSLELPPLRKREGDIALLVKSFLGAGWTVSSEAMAAIERCPWPGNVRQLRNAIDRAQILADGHVITPGDLPAEVLSGLGTINTGAAAAPAAFRTSLQRPAAPERNGWAISPGSSGGDLPCRLEDLEKAHIVEILRQQNGNKARAARVLGIHRRKLYRLLERHGLHEERPLI